MIESRRLENVRNVLRKAYEFYKALDEIKDREEYRIIEAIDRIPLNCLLATNSNEVRLAFSREKKLKLNKYLF